MQERWRGAVPGPSRTGLLRRCAPSSPARHARPGPGSGRPPPPVAGGRWGDPLLLPAPRLLQPGGGGGGGGLPLLESVLQGNLSGPQVR
jgi:hypothetical protein